ncbi:MAG: SBBP repeat-containing protein [Verrucomicrobia bacterium]|nr:SBBP repeat-containing protein [Verrucomicrobiota bacterium]
MISFDRDDNLRWTRLWGSRSGDVGYGVVVDRARRVYVTGHAPSNQPFDATAGAGLHSRYTQGVQFLTQFNTDGVKFGSQTWGSTNCSAEAIAWDGEARLYLRVMPSTDSTGRRVPGTTTIA